MEWHPALPFADFVADLRIPVILTNTFAANWTAQSAWSDLSYVADVVGRDTVLYGVKSAPGRVFRYYRFQTRAVRTVVPDYAAPFTEHNMTASEFLDKAWVGTRGPEKEHFYFNGGTDRGGGCACENVLRWVDSLRVAGRHVSRFTCRLLISFHHLLPAPPSFLPFCDRAQTLICCLPACARICPPTTACTLRTASRTPVRSLPTCGLAPRGSPPIFTSTRPTTTLPKYDTRSGLPVVASWS